MKKKYALMGLAGSIAVVAIVGGSLAAFNTSTENNAGTGIAQISTKSIEITGVGTSGDSISISDAALPGKSYECRYNVLNSVSEEKDAYGVYARVVIDKKWDTEDGLDAGMTGIAYSLGEENEVYEGDLIQTQTDGSGLICDNDWILTYEDGEQVVLYYTKPLDKGESTTDFMDAVEFSERMGNRYMEKNLTLEITIDAVQIDSNEDAMQAEWGVFPLIDEATGELMNVFETKAERDSYK